MSAPPAGAAYRLDQVTVRFGPTAALERVDLAIEPGERVALVGPSGSGKTTLLRLLGATLLPSDGRVLVDGRDLATLPPSQLRSIRTRIGTVYQDLRLVPELRVFQNVVAGRIGRRSLLGLLRDLTRPAAPVLREVHGILDRVGIEEKLYQRVDQLSGGQRQRVALARALYQEPLVLLADEPISSIDPARARDALELVCGVARERGLTLCVSLHNLELARELFPRLIGVRRGRVEFDAPAASLAEEDFRRLYELSESELLEEGADR